MVLRYFKLFYLEPGGSIIEQMVLANLSKIAAAGHREHNMRQHHTLVFGRSIFKLGVHGLNFE